MATVFCGNVDHRPLSCSCINAGAQSAHVLSVCTYSTLGRYFEVEKNLQSPAVVLYACIVLGTVIVCFFLLLFYLCFLFSAKPCCTAALCAYQCVFCLLVLFIVLFTMVIYQYVLWHILEVKIILFPLKFKEHHYSCYVER